MTFGAMDMINVFIGWLLGAAGVFIGIAVSRRNPPEAAPAPEEERKETIDRQWESLMRYDGRDQRLEDDHADED